MGTREGASDAPSDLADATHEPNQFYDPQEAAADRQDAIGRLPSAVARVRQALGEARASTDRAVIDRLITNVEALIAVVEEPDLADRAESPAATAPADLEE
jgi:hypothetical protein